MTHGFFIEKERLGLVVQVVWTGKQIERKREIRLKCRLKNVLQKTACDDI